MWNEISKSKSFWLSVATVIAFWAWLAIGVLWSFWVLAVPVIALCAGGLSFCVLIAAGDIWHDITGD